MLDLQKIRLEKETVEKMLYRRGTAISLDTILSLDEKNRKITTDLQQIQQDRNSFSQQIGLLKKEQKHTEADAMMEKVNVLKETMFLLEKDQAQVSTELEQLLLEIPNTPAQDIPDGKDENDNVEIDRWGEPKELAHAKDHDDIGIALGLMQPDLAAKLSGSRFMVMRGALAKLERALGQFMLDLQTNEFGYTEVSVPILVRDHCMFGTGQLPKFREDQFKTTNDYWLIPTAEVPVTNLVRDEILSGEELPLRLTALTPCFRAEAGAAGKDTKGMIRQHQFWKVEMVSITRPDQAFEEHERMTENAREILRRLGLPFRTVMLCAGDIGFGAKKTYDLEVWLPGQKKYREISSCSHFGDFQARRMKTRFKNSGEKNTNFVHTLNGSGLAVGRTLVAILENYVQPDGSILLPEAIQPYMGGLKRIEKDV